MNQEQNQHLADDEIDLKELFSVIWQGKLWIITTTFTAAAIAIIFALSTPSIYRSEALLAPVSSDDKGLGGLASSLGGLASLAGVSLQRGGNADKTLIGIEVLKSRQFFSNFMTKYDVLVPLIAADGWNAETRKLQIDPDVYDEESQVWYRTVKPPLKSGPSIQEAHKKFLSILDVTQNKETGFVTISIEHFSPYVAQHWVELLINEINQTIRQQDIQQAERSISYLKEQIKATQFAELHPGFFELIKSQIETIMLANATPEYLFKTLDPAVVPESKAKPNRKLIVVLGTILGGMLGLLMVLIRHFSFNTYDA